MLSVLKLIGAPGSVGFLALCCAIGLACRAAGWVRLGRAWLLTVYFLYVVAGLPVVANAVAWGLSSHRPIQDLSAIHSADAIIVLHGDNELGRVRETKRVFDATGAPLVLVLGAPDFVARLVRVGVPQERLVTGASPGNTFGQIVDVARFVCERNLKNPVLVASRLHMPRIAALLRAQQLDVLLAPSPIDDEPPVSGIRRFLPVYRALRVTRDVVYEHLAIRYYRYKRLIR